MPICDSRLSGARDLLDALRFAEATTCLTRSKLLYMGSIGNNGIGEEPCHLRSPFPA